MDEKSRKVLNDLYKQKGRSPEAALDCLLVEVSTEQKSSKRLDRHIIEIIENILAGDSVFGDKTYAEAGQKSTMPEYWRPACEYMESQGVTPETVEKYLRDKIAEMESE